MARKPFFHREQLDHIRRSADWRRLFAVLGIEKDDAHSNDHDYWGKSPFQPAERTASFHMNDKGWYCHSTHAVAPGRDSPGGGVIELVQAVHATRGQIMKLNEAAQWLIDNGVAALADSGEPAEPISVSPARPAQPVEHTPNHPIRIDLVPALTLQGTHPEFVRRGIGEATCRMLRCGYLAEGRTPLAGRLVFQIAGVEERPDGTLARTILSHTGRALTAEQDAAHGKWWVYKGFNKSLELYNLDTLLLDPVASEQARSAGRVIVVEGPFDVAKLAEAGIRNVVSTLGSHLSPDQIPRFALIAARLGVKTVSLWFDRDQAGINATEAATALLSDHGFITDAFDWSIAFPSARRGAVTLPATIADPCDFTVEQLRWLRDRNHI